MKFLIPFGRMLKMNEKPIHPVRKKIEEFSILRPGWYFGEGSTISQQVILDTLELFDAGLKLEFTEFDTFPGPDGSIMLVMYESEDNRFNRIEFIINNDHTISFSLEQNEFMIREFEDIDLDQALNELLRYRKDGKCKLSESLISKTITSGELSRLTTTHS
jgi:hypothetical protein